jgi:hypothetical protein
MSAKKVWVEVPVRFNLDWTLSGQGAQDAQPVTGLAAVVGVLGPSRRTPGRRPAPRLPMG